MSPHLGKFWFTVAIGITLMSLALLSIIEPHTSAYYIDLFSLAIGIAMLLIVAILVRRANK